MKLDALIAAVPSIQSGVYRHWEGNLYWVPGIVSLDEESGRYRVLYRALASNVWWAREYADFVSRGKIVTAVIDNQRRDSFVVGEYSGRRFTRVGGFGLYVGLRVTDAWRGWLGV
jgi:hypothetical protein